MILVPIFIIDMIIFNSQFFSCKRKLSQSRYFAFSLNIKRWKQEKMHFKSDPKVHSQIELFVLLSFYQMSFFTSK